MKKRLVYTTEAEDKTNPEEDPSHFRELPATIVASRAT